MTRTVTGPAFAILLALAAGCGRGAKSASSATADAHVVAGKSEANRIPGARLEALERSVIADHFIGSVNKLAFDGTNRVYLVVSESNPVRGRFLDAHGKPIGAPFPISLEAIGENHISWASVTFGGPSTDPTFLVTYAIGALRNAPSPRMARFVRYQAGASPRIGEPVKIADTFEAVTYSDQALSIWDGQRFLIGTNVGQTITRTDFPGVQLNHLDMSGNVTGGGLLSDGRDAEVNAHLACAVDAGVCLAVGSAWGAPFGAPWGGTWMRLFDMKTLAPRSDVVYLEKNHRDTSGHSVAFNPRIGRFLAVWAGGGKVNISLIGTDGTVSFDASKALGPVYGEQNLAYNAKTGTTLLTTVYAGDPKLCDTGVAWSDLGPEAQRECGSLRVLELGDDGYPIPGFNPVFMSAWDGRSKFFRSDVVADEIHGRWLVIWSQFEKAQTAILGHVH